MSFYVHFQVCFQCNNRIAAAELAKQYLPNFGDANVVRWFLEDLAAPDLSPPRQRNQPLWELYMWGGIFNGPGVERFVEVLKPFWEDLLSGAVEGAPGPYNHILVFYQNEQTEAANAYEISWTNQWTKENRYLVIRHHERLPFSWKQY